MMTEFTHIGMVVTCIFGKDHDLHTTGDYPKVSAEVITILFLIKMNNGKLKII